MSRRKPQISTLPKTEESVEQRHGLNSSIADLLPKDVWVLIMQILGVLCVERLRQTCQWLYYIGQDNEIWIRRCFKCWPTEALCDDVSLYGNSWKRMYYERYRLRRDGVYISRCSYARYVRPLGNIHIDDPVKRLEQMNLAGAVQIDYCRYLKFINKHFVLILRSEVPEKDALEVIKSIEMSVRLAMKQRRRSSAKDPSSNCDEDSLSWFYQRSDDILSASPRLTKSERRGLCADSSFPPGRIEEITSSEGFNDNDPLSHSSSHNEREASASDVRGKKDLLRRLEDAQEILLRSATSKAEPRHKRRLIDLVSIGVYQFPKSNNAVRILYAPRSRNDWKLTIMLKLSHVNHGNKFRFNSKLSWIGYWTENEDNEEERCDFDLESVHFKPFHFSPLKAYASYV